MTKEMYLGGSDIAQLLLTSCESEQGIAFALRMGGDGGYTAHIIEGGEKVRPHYKKVYTCRKWLWVYDDTGRTAQFRANIIKVYRAGDYGITIELVNEEEKI